MIGDLLSTAARAQKLDIASIQRGIQDGVIPSYIGIPLLQQKMQERTEAAQMLAGKQAQNQPPIAQQVMSQAQQMTQPQAAPAMQQPQMQQPAEPGGIDQAQSNLPQAGFAGGGIVAFDDGGNVSMDPFADEDMSEEDMEDQQMDQDLMSDRQFAYAPESMAAPTYNEMSYSRDSSSMKEPGQPEHGVAHEEISAKGKRGLEDLLDLIKHKESRGRDYDTKGNPLTSPVGAKYAMQVMPATARDPGFGIKPAQSDSPDEYNRVGRELYSKLLDKYGDPKLAAIAYNMGPGKTDKWLSSGADMATLPQESRQYAQGFKEGGVAHFDGGGIADVFNMSPSDVKDYARRLMNMSDARAAFSAQPEAAAVAPAATGAATEGLGLGSLARGFSKYAGPIGMAAQNLFFTSPEEMETLRKADRARSLANQSDAETQRLANQDAVAATGSYYPKLPVTTSNLSKPSYSRAMGPGVNESQAAVPDKTTETTGAPVAAQKPADTETKTAEPSGIEALFSQQAADNKKQRDINNYLALMSAGFGMMGGSSPYAFQNIGKGAQQGVATLAELNKGVGEDERALMNARISAQNAKARNDYYQAVLEERKRAAMSAGDVKQQTLNQKNEAQANRERQQAELNYQNFYKMNQTQALANAKSVITPEDRQKVLDQADKDFYSRPEVQSLYEKAFGMKMPSMGAKVMSADRAAQFSVNR